MGLERKRENTNTWYSMGAEKLSLSLSLPLGLCSVSDFVVSLFNSHERSDKEVMLGSVGSYGRLRSVYLGSGLDRWHCATCASKTSSA